MTGTQPSAIGFIGLGIMGEAMARNLLKTGCKLVVWNRSPAKVGGPTARSRFALMHHHRGLTLGDARHRVYGNPTDAEVVTPCIEALANWQPPPWPTFPPSPQPPLRPPPLAFPRSAIPSCLKVLCAQLLPQRWHSSVT